MAGNSREMSVRWKGSVTSVAIWATSMSASRFNHTVDGTQAKRSRQASLYLALTAEIPCASFLCKPIPATINIRVSTIGAVMTKANQSSTVHADRTE